MWVWWRWWWFFTNKKWCCIDSNDITIHVSCRTISGGFKMSDNWWFQKHILPMEENKTSRSNHTPAQRKTINSDRKLDVQQLFYYYEALSMTGVSPVSWNRDKLNTCKVDLHVVRHFEIAYSSSFFLLPSLEWNSRRALGKKVEVIPSQIDRTVEVPPENREFFVANRSCPN